MPGFVLWMVAIAAMGCTSFYAWRSHHLAFEGEPALDWAAGEGGGFDIDFRSLWLVLSRNLLVIGGIVLAGLVLGLVVTMLTTPRYTAQASIQIDQQADQVLGDAQDQVQPTVAYQDADRFLQTQVDVLKSRAMAIRVAQALNLFNDPKFFDKMKVTPPDPDPSVPRQQQLQDATVEVMLDDLGVSLPVDSRVATISLRDLPTPLWAA